MQVQYKALVEVPARHQIDPAVKASADAAAEQLAPLVWLALVGFVGFVVFRAFRWFFRATR